LRQFKRYLLYNDLKSHDYLLQLRRRARNIAEFAEDFNRVSLKGTEVLFPNLLHVALRKVFSSLVMNDIRKNPPGNLNIMSYNL